MFGLLPRDENFFYLFEQRAVDTGLLKIKVFIVLAPLLGMALGFPLAASWAPSLMCR